MPTHLRTLKAPPSLVAPRSSPATPSPARAAPRPLVRGLPSRYPQTMGTLVLLRHGESEWNSKGLFTGWVDVPLSSTGADEARGAGRLLQDAGLRPDVLYTSVLTRAIQTAHIALEAADLLWLPVRRSWRLNERHYGALQGKDKAQTRDEVGDEQFMIWGGA